MPVPSMRTFVCGPTMTWAPPHERVDRDHDLLGGELGLPQVELRAAHEGEHGQLLGHHPDPAAVEAAHDREVRLLVRTRDDVG